MYKPKTPRNAARNSGGDGDTLSSLSRTTTTVTFSGNTARSRTTGASELSRLSTASKREAAAVGHVHTVLREQMSVLRRVFQEVDRERDGQAARVPLRDAIIAALRLHPRWLPGLDRLLDLTDPTGTGSVVFGRLTRLVRTPYRLTEHADGGASVDWDARATNAVGAASPRGPKHPVSFDVADDGDEQLRQTFAGVDTGDRQLLRRLGSPREMPPMATGVRATNILGDSRVRAPWAVAGDDARMQHILTSIHKERFTDLIVVLRRHTSPTTPDLMSFRQLQQALHEFDPFAHDAEILQYFLAMANDTHGTSSERLQSADGSARNASGSEDTLLPARFRKAYVGIEPFVARFGTNVLAAPAMRCSANFALKWSLPRPQQPVPPRASVRSGGISHRGAKGARPSPRAAATTNRAASASTAAPPLAAAASRRVPVPPPPKAVS